MHEDELAGKIRAHQQEDEYRTQACRGDAQTTGSMPGVGYVRPGLRERVGNQLQETHRALRNAQLLEELALLLAKHSDVARILDLLEETSS